MNVKTLRKSNIKNKTILYRAPYDIGTKKVGNEYILKDSSRIKATLETIQYMLEQNCKIVILTWVKRPENGYEEKYSTKPHAKELSKLLKHPVKHLNDCIGESVRKEISNMNNGDIIMLENTRFYKEEFTDDDDFAKELAKNGEFIVFDGFPQSHRIHASTTGILRHLPSCTGFYMEKELMAIGNISTKPQKPLTIIIGGAKISDKVSAIKNLQNKADYIIVIGGVANIFLKAKGVNIQKSFTEDLFVDKAKKEKLDTTIVAKEIIKNKNNLIIPIDCIVANSIDNPTETKAIDITKDYISTNIPENWTILDIGNKTIKLIEQIMAKSKTIFWNGPAGLFENPLFQTGTKKLIENISQTDKNIFTLISGGDTIEALNKFGIPKSISHISLAGGATFEVLAGNELPVMKYLMD